MTATKVITIHGALGKVETTYGAGDAVAIATDGILTEARVPGVVTYLNDGSREEDAKRGAPMKRGKPTGKSVAATLPVVGRGRGVAYSGSVFPPDVHALLRAAGFAATFATTKWEYVPSLAAPASLSMELYDRGQKWIAKGVYADMNFRIDGPGFMRFEFPIEGIAVGPSDASVPSITYLDRQPPKCEGLAVAIGAYTPAKVRAIEFALGRERGARADVNVAGGHAGFGVGGIAPTMRITMEAAALSGSATPTPTTIDPVKMHEEAAEVALSFTVGSVSTDRIKFEASKAIVSGPIEDGADGPVALWTIPFDLAPSAPGLVDCLKLTWD